MIDQAFIAVDDISLADILFCQRRTRQINSLDRRPGNVIVKYFHLTEYVFVSVVEWDIQMKQKSYEYPKTATKNTANIWFYYGLFIT